jgi:polysaccharide export outer membrane protein
MGGCGKPQTSSTRAGGGPRPEYVDTLRRGDLVEVRFTGNPTPPTDKAERIKDDGTISLPLIGAVQAEGKTAGQLQNDIYEMYVPQFFRQLTVTVNTESRYFYVYGEVQQPGRLLYSGQITTLQAIAAAGGFTDFAARSRIELVRLNGEQHVINGRRADNNPGLDLPVIPGDTINVPRRNPFGR